MKIAIAKEGSNVSAHFGHCEGFEVYTVNDNKVVESTFLQNPGHQPGVLPKFLKENEVDTIISGGMGRMAQDLFTKNDIAVVVGAKGSLEEAISEYVKGQLASTNSVCDDHQHKGSCGEH